MTRTSSTALLLLVVPFLLIADGSVIGCKKQAAAIDGFGKWRFGKTTAKDGIVCSKRKSYTFCSNNGPVTLAGQKASVNLYFEGTESEAPLSEIELAVSRCPSQGISRALFSKLGEPSDKQPAKMRWNGTHATIIALIPTPEEECLIYFLRPSESKRMQELWSGKKNK